MTRLNIDDGSYRPAVDHSSRSVLRRSGPDRGWDDHRRWKPRFCFHSRKGESHRFRRCHSCARPHRHSHPWRRWTRCNAGLRREPGCDRRVDGPARGDELLSNNGDSVPIDTTLKSLEKLGSAIALVKAGQSADPARARPLGVHLEGPFLSHARRGVHPSDLLQPASRDLFQRMWDATGGQVSVLTIAPELEGAPELIADAAGKGICTSLGHSDASLMQALTGIAAGARHATHTFNAMRPLDHRDPGLLGVVLTDERLTADVIATRMEFTWTRWSSISSYEPKAWKELCSSLTPSVRRACRTGRTCWGRLKSKCETAGAWLMAGWREAC